MFPTPATARWSSSTALTGARLPASARARTVALNPRSSGSPPGLAPPPGRRSRARAAPALGRLGAELALEVAVELAGLEHDPSAEPPHVAIGDIRAVV